MVVAMTDKLAGSICVVATSKGNMTVYWAAARMDCNADRSAAHTRSSDGPETAPGRRPAAEIPRHVRRDIADGEFRGYWRPRQ